MKIAPGVLINDRYRLTERIAVGGTGEVWRATDQVLTREVAVKLLSPQRLDDTEVRQRFRSEARHAAQLSHPGVAEVHDFGELDDAAFIVMEYLPGRSLAAILERNGQLSVAATLELVAQVAYALQAAHGIGLIHRDIKPANLIVGPDGEVKITDFGTARALDASTVTEPGVVVGTAQYMSPEQAAGKSPSPAADLYGLGVVAYTCLAGEPPFSGPSPVEIATAHVQEEPPPLPGDIPLQVRQLVGACLAKAPERRPASAAELATRCAAARAVLPRPPSDGYQKPQRRPFPLGAAAAGAAAAVGGMLFVGSGPNLTTVTPIVDDAPIQSSGDRPHPAPTPGPARDSPLPPGPVAYTSSPSLAPGHLRLDTEPPYEQENTSGSTRGLARVSPSESVSSSAAGEPSGETPGSGNPTAPQTGAPSPSGTGTSGTSPVGARPDREGSSGASASQAGRPT